MAIFLDFLTSCRAFSHQQRIRFIPSLDGSWLHSPWSLAHLLLGNQHELSYFDPVRSEQAERCAFLQELKTQMLMPVMPNAADQDYLITQAIADFLATHRDLNLDGILFPSVQSSERTNAGNNVVLFHKASGVERTEEGDALEHVQLCNPHFGSTAAFGSTGKTASA